MKFRPVRGGLATSMKEVQEWNTIEELELIVFEETRGYWSQIPRGTPIKVEQYAPWAGPDTRIDPPWDTHLVSIVGRDGKDWPVGFTDGPLPG